MLAAVQLAARQATAVERTSSSRPSDSISTLLDWWTCSAAPTPYQPARIRIAPTQANTVAVEPWVHRAPSRSRQIRMVQPQAQPMPSVVTSEPARIRAAAAWWFGSISTGSRSATAASTNGSSQNRRSVSSRRARSCRPTTRTITATAIRTLDRAVISGAFRAVSSDRKNATENGPPDPRSTG